MARWKIDSCVYNSQELHHATLSSSFSCFYTDTFQFHPFPACNRFLRSSKQSTEELESDHHDIFRRRRRKILRKLRRLPRPAASSGLKFIKNLQFTRWLLQAPTSCEKTNLPSKTIFENDQNGIRRFDLPCFSSVQQIAKYNESVKHEFYPKGGVDWWFWQKLLFYGLLTRYDQHWGRASARLILYPPRLVCPPSRHKGRASLREAMTHFMLILTPTSLNATPAQGFLHPPLDRFFLLFP